MHAATAARFGARFAPHGFRGDAMMPVYGLAEATLAVAFPELTAKMETVAVDRDALERGVARPSASSLSGAVRDAVSVGIPVAGTTIEVLDGAGSVVPEQTVGEIVVTSPSRMDGYYRNDAASRDAISGDRLRTGDLGFVMGGRLFVTGRSKDLIIKAGRNVYPYDVERVAGQVDGVRLGGAAAFARPNEAPGTDDLVVVAETTHKDPARREQIAAGVRAELLEVLGVRADCVLVRAVGAVPRATSGKVRRGQCARLFAAGALAGTA